MRDLRPPVRVAEEVGTQLGRGEVLLGSLPENEVMSQRDVEKEGVWQFISAVDFDPERVVPSAQVGGRAATGGLGSAIEEMETP